ncbi:MAG: carboxypeptidase-like regulatory domain-containing protein [Cyclobacteriaceae bacterium]
MKNILLLFVLALGTVFSLIAQSRTVTGRVTSEDEPNGIPGVNVQVKGTMAGSITDIDGTYSLGVPEGSNLLVFSFLGFEPQEVNLVREKIRF